jgi:hypothetical protein
MFPSFGGINLVDDESSTGSGAAFNLDRPSRGDGSVTVGGHRFEVLRDGRVVVARTTGDSSYESALGSAFLHVQEALDLWSFTGVDDLAITRAHEDHVAWWPTAAGLIVRVVWIDTMGMRIRAQGVVTDSHGNAVELEPRAPLAWDASFRYFRLSQVSADLFDSYRNAYLALESLLSSITPQKVNTNGRPAEGDRAWFQRALSAAASRISLSDVVPEAPADPVEFILQDLYAGTRSATFHAKAGRAALLPRDSGNRARVTSSLERLVRIYLALAIAHLGAGRPRSSLSTEAFRVMSSAVLSDIVTWVSDDESPSDTADLRVNPRGGPAVQLPTTEAVDTRVPFLTTKLAAGTTADLGSLPYVRRIAGTTPDGTPMLLKVLEERLVLGSATRLEVIFGLRNRNEGPRVDFPT